MITDRIGLHSVLLPLYGDTYQTMELYPHEKENKSNSRSNKQNKG